MLTGQGEIHLCSMKNSLGVYLSIFAGKCCYIPSSLSLRRASLLLAASGAVYFLPPSSFFLFVAILISFHAVTAAPSYPYILWLEM